MFKIGEFSCLTRVTVKTLRFYDEMGLLKPEHVDEFTGYRYYSAEQIPRLNRILVLKGLGFSLEEIAQLLEEGLPLTEMQGMLRMKQSEIRWHIAEEEERLRKVEARLRQLQQEGTMSGYEVVVKHVPSQFVVSVQDTLSGYSDVSRLFGEVFGYLGKRFARPAGPAMMIYHDPEYREHDINVEVAVPVKKIMPGSDRVKSYELEGIEAASLIHLGSYDLIGQAYETLMRWTQVNGYQVSGPPREVYIKGPGQGKPETYTTEIQVPVAKP